MNNYTFDIIIPCVFRHFKNIPWVLDSFDNFNNVKNIIIVISALKDNDLNLSELKTKEYYSKIIFITFCDRIKPGIARNKGLQMSTCEYVIFHDADDKVHPQKIDIIKYFFNKYKDVDQILHLIQPVNMNFIKYDVNKINYVSCEDLIKYKDNMKNSDFGEILGKRMSHGLISIKRQKALDIDWINRNKGEDKNFNLKSLEKGNNIILLDAFLSKYDKYRDTIMKNYHPDGYDELINGEKI